MPRHRAPSPRPLSALAAGVSLGVCTLTSAVLPGTALAATADGQQTDLGHRTTDSHAADGHSAVDSYRNRHRRALTSGERQYRNGCRQGYIHEDCEQFSISNLLHRGINPLL